MLTILSSLLFGATAGAPFASARPRATPRPRSARSRGADLRVALLFVLGLGLNACTNPCRDQTVLITVTLADAAADADALAVTVQIDGGTSSTFTAPVPAGTTSGTIEVTFPSGYPAGQTVGVTIEAQRAGAALASGSAATTLTESCGTLEVALGGGPGAGDGGADGCTPSTSCPSTQTCGSVPDGCGGTVSCGPPCQLTALDQPMASTGDTVTLEGRFADPTAVTFPGGATANATLLGPNRATVVVPPSAGEGLLTVTSGGTTTPGLPFRRVTFPIELQPWRSHYEQAEYARMLHPMPDDRHWATAVTGPRYVWIIGGNFSGGDTVLEAMINADGTLGALKPSPNKLTTARAQAAALRIGNYLYVFGGRAPGSTGSKSIETVERAPIEADGRIGAFSVVPDVTIQAQQVVGPTTYRGRFGHSAHVIGDSVYLVAGAVGAFCAPERLKTVERAPINADGSLGDFQIVPSVQLAAPRNMHGALVKGNLLYVLGGETTGMPFTLDSIEMAAIQPDGSLSPFVDGGGPLPNAREAIGVYAFGNTVYVLGTSGNGTVVKANILASGKLDTFVSSTTHLSPDGSAGGMPYNYAHALVGNYLYVFGAGFENSCSAAAFDFGRVVQRASLQAGGTISAFTQVNTVNYAAPGRGSALAVIADKVYAIGGQPMGGSDLEVATLGADGKLQTFEVASGTLKVPRAGTKAAVIGDHLYLVGGTALGTAAPANTVEVAPILPDGTLGPFDVAKANGNGANVTLPNGRTGHKLLVVPHDPNNPSHKAKLCVLGGTSSVDCTSINPDGTLTGSFTALAAATLMDNMVLGLLANGRVFVTGNSGDVSSAPYDDSGTITAAFAKTSSGFGPPMARAAATVGSGFLTLGGFGGLIGSESSQVARVAIPATGNLGDLADSGVSLNLPHSGPAAVVLGTRLWVIGGSTGQGPAPTESAELR